MHVRSHLAQLRRQLPELRVCYQNGNYQRYPIMGRPLTANPLRQRFQQVQLAVVVVRRDCVGSQSTARRSPNNGEIRDFEAVEQLTKTAGNYVLRHCGQDALPLEILRHSQFPPQSGQ